MKKEYDYPWNLIEDLKRQCWFQSDYNPIEMQISAADVDRLINTLDPYTREIMLSRYKDKMKYKELAQKYTQFTFATIGPHCRRALDHMAWSHVMIRTAEQKGKTSIATLPLPTRVINALIRSNMYNIEDVTSCSYAQIKRIRGIDRYSYNVLLQIFQEHDIDTSLMLPDDMSA